MLTGGRGIDGLDRLDIRLVAVLGLALLPIGIIAMVQTYRVIDAADNNAEAALLGATLSAANTERESILNVRGAAQIAAGIMPALLDELETCSQRLEDFVTSYPQVSFAGFVDNSGQVRCGSQGVGGDVSQSLAFRAYSEEPASTVHAVVGRISRQAVVVVSEPVPDETDPSGFAGYVTLSVPQQPLQIAGSRGSHLTPLQSLTFSVNGDLIGVNSDTGEDISGVLPRNRTLASMAEGGARTFTATSNGGNPRIYTVAPLIPDVIYALSVWHPQALRTTGLTAASALLFPLLMWLVSIGVAYFAVHRLVVRHIRYLRMRIRAFSANRKILTPEYNSDTPSELREVIEVFHQMTERIVRDEAELENSLHEKDVLLKEVHHRVKNNLQLITSMINMQLRKSKNAETRFMLRRLQDRVLGLATIHRNLYRASVLSRVDSGQLIGDLMEQVIGASDVADLGVDVQIDVAEIALYPDQAVPLSLLVTEAVTNALKYVGRPKEGRPWIVLKLVQRDDGQVVLTVANSVGSPTNVAEDVVSTGLGTQLMSAFVMQLDAESNIHETDDRYEIKVAFTPSEFADEA